MKQAFFVFDVESIGLHGEGYAVAGCVCFDNGVIDPSSEFVFSCEPEKASGHIEDREWVSNNIPCFETNCDSPREVRNKFWECWENAKKTYPDIVMAGECVWPVETEFLSACVRDDVKNRRWNGPYPLHEIASFMQAANMNPLENYNRLDSEQPKHHPLADARQSCRLLCEAISVIEDNINSFLPL